MSDLDFRKTFGKRLSLVMRDKKLTQTELSNITGISRYTIASYVRGTGNPTPYNVYKILSALDCTETEFTYIGGIYTREVDRIEKLGDSLNRIMRERNLTIKDVSEMTGLSTSTIQKYLLKQASPNIKKISRIADALDCDIEEFIDFDLRLI